MVGCKYDITLEAVEILKTFNPKMGKKPKDEAARNPDTFLEEERRKKIGFHISDTQ